MKLTCPDCFRKCEAWWNETSFSWNSYCKHCIKGIVEDDR